MNTHTHTHTLHISPKPSAPLIKVKYVREMEYLVTLSSQKCVSLGVRASLIVSLSAQSHTHTHT